MSTAPSTPEFRFDASLRDRWQSDGNGGWTFAFPTGWMQGRSVFGGLSAAAATALAHRHIGADRALRQVHTQLLRPTAAGSVDGSVLVRREGKYCSFVEVILSQGGAATVIANFVFAAGRDDATAFPAAAPTDSFDPTSLDPVPYIPNLMPEFVQRMDIRYTDAGAVEGDKQARLHGFCRFRDPSGGPEGVLGLMDCFPAPSLIALGRPVPASTVSWTAHIIAAPEAFDGFCRFEYETVVGLGGMHTLVGQLRSETGELLGWTEQLAAVFG